MSGEFCECGLIAKCAKTGGDTTGCLNLSGSAGGMCRCVVCGWRYHLLGRRLRLALLQWALTLSERSAHTVWLWFVVVAYPRISPSFDIDV